VPKAVAADHVTLYATDYRIGDPIKVDVDFVLLLTGYVMDETLFKIAGVKLTDENQAPIYDKQTMQSNVPGIYIAGTAAAGTQVTFRLFIENCHIHVKRIIAAITGSSPPTHTELDDSRLES